MTAGLLNTPEGMVLAEPPASYPAHLHIDLLPEWQGGLGYERALMGALPAALREGRVLCHGSELGRWYPLLGVRDAERNDIRLYADGVLASMAVAGPADVSTDPFAFGRAKWGAGTGTSGRVRPDGVHAFDKALASEDVAALHAAEKP
ncbi:LamG-like jellyroll fold domain-containing protein [Streptomyces sp. NPDC033754]|uniref:LamG-like jellyroll fold domain-containing protein n=1 Tax=unclassified Streptomyces TaxID=2593676 RepID=UPI0033C934A1